MRAAVMREFRGDLTIEHVDIDTPRADEVLIRTVASGICHTDLTYWGGRHPHPLPMILGHEGCGIVEAIGPGVTNVAVGDAVVTCMTSFCGHCDRCVTGDLVLCESLERDRPAEARPKLALGGERVHSYGRLGTFAEKMLVYKNSCVRIRPDVPLDKASVVGCGVLTGVGAVINTAKLQPGQSVAVIGCGGVGLSAINGAAIAGAGRIVAVDTQTEKLELARAFGATDCVDASQGDAARQVMEMTRGGVDVAFEAVGTPQTAQAAFGMIRRGGAMILVGMLPPDETVSFPGKEFIYGKKVIGSMLGSNRFPHDIPKLIEFYMQGKLKLDELVSQRIALDDVNEALHQVGKGGVARSVIVFG